MIRTLRPMLRDRGGVGAAEFALVLPLLILLLFGIIDTGRFFYQLNRSEKATQMGARLAIVTTPASPDLIEANFIAGDVGAGDLIPADTLGTVLCTSAGCSCEVAPCPFTNGAVDADAFGEIAERMAQMNPLIEPENVQVRYSGSGFGYADTNDETMDVQPLVTVSVDGMQFSPISLLGLAGFNLPEARATLTAEDSSGTFSN